MKLKHKSVNAIQHILRCKALGVAFPLVSMFFIIYLMVSGVNIKVPIRVERGVEAVEKG